MLLIIEAKKYVSKCRIHAVNIRANLVFDYQSMCELHENVSSGRCQDVNVSINLLSIIKAKEQVSRCRSCAVNIRANLVFDYQSMCELN